MPHRCALHSVELCRPGRINTVLRASVWLGASVATEATCPTAAASWRHRAPGRREEATCPTAAASSRHRAPGRREADERHGASRALVNGPAGTGRDWRRGLVLLGQEAVGTPQRPPA